MKLKSLLPWLCALGLLIGLAWVYAASQKKDAELAALREDSQQLPLLRAELEEAKTNLTQADSAELVRLRKDNEELLRLRNEARQLRVEKQQLATQLQTAQRQVQSAQTQVQGVEAQYQALRARPAQQAPPAQLNPAAQAAFAARYGLAMTNAEQAIPVSCVNNLRMIDGAKQQWALEHQKQKGALLTAADLTPYLRGNVLPVCPSGGVYTLNPVGLAPICNIPGHAL
jgi:chromosome segregation ATPase